MLYIIFYARLQQKTKTNVFPYCSPCRMHKLIKSVEKKVEAFCFLKKKVKMTVMNVASKSDLALEILPHSLIHI